jgi:hypothetical protein
LRLAAPLNEAINKRQGDPGTKKHCTIYYFSSHAGERGLIEIKLYGSRTRAHSREFITVAVLSDESFYRREMGKRVFLTAIKLNRSARMPKMEKTRKSH